MPMLHEVFACLLVGSVLETRHYRLRIISWQVVTCCDKKLIQHQENMAVYRRGSIFYGCSGWCLKIT